MLRGTGDNGGGSDVRLDLPAPSVENLPAIFEAIQAHGKAGAELEQLCHGMIRTEYYRLLFDVFDECEAQGKTEGLHWLFRIWRALLFANNVPLLEVILSEECVLRFFGCLECDPRVPPERHVKHRAFLSQTMLKEVVPLPNEDLRTRIRQTFYIQYLRDVILAGVIDDGISTTINSFVIYNQMEIVSLVRRDPDILQNVLRQMQDPDLSDAVFLEKMSFVLELCSLGKMCNVTGRMELYSLLSSLGIFQVLELALRRADCQIRTAACEIINLAASHNVSLLRNYVLAQPPSKPSFVLLLVDGVVSEPDPGLKSQFTGILQALLDPDGMDKINAKDQMLGMWYESCMSRLMEPLVSTPLEEGTAAKEHVLDLLEFCIRFHDFRVKYFILGNNITRHVVALTEHRDRHMQLAAVRLVRVIVGIRDSFFDRHLIRHHFLDPIIGLLVSNAGANNLIDSAILEMLEYIRVCPIVPLAKEIVSRHKQVLLDVRYVSTCGQLVSMVETWEREGMGSNGQLATTPPVSAESPTRKRARNSGNMIGAGVGDLDEAWLEDDLDDAFRKSGGSSVGNMSSGAAAAAAALHHHMSHHSIPETMMDFAILPPMPSLPSSSRRLLDDDDELPLLDRHDTPPINFPGHGGGAGSSMQPGFTFASLRLPSEPSALVAGLAAEATRHLAEASTGGSFWDAPGMGSPPAPPPPMEANPVSPPPARGSDEDEEEKRKRRRSEESNPVSSLVDEFLRDSL